MLEDWEARPLYEVKAGLFRGLSHPYRIRLLELLADGAEHTVGELIASTHLEASHASQHLSVLRRHRLVASVRRGSHVYYRLVSPRVAELLAVARTLLVELTTVDAQAIDGLADLPRLPEHRDASGGDTPGAHDTADDPAEAPASAAARADTDAASAAAGADTDAATPTETDGRSES